MTHCAQPIIIYGRRTKLARLNTNAATWFSLLNVSSTNLMQLYIDSATSVAYDMLCGHCWQWDPTDSCEWQYQSAAASLFLHRQCDQCRIRYDAWSILALRSCRSISGMTPSCETLISRYSHCCLTSEFKLEHQYYFPNFVMRMILDELFCSTCTFRFRSMHL